MRSALIVVFLGLAAALLPVQAQQNQVVNPIATGPARSFTPGSGTLNCASSNDSEEFSLIGIASVRMRLTGTIDSGCTISFELLSPTDGTWQWLAGFGYADSGGTIVNSFDINTTTAGTWIFTGIGGATRVRVRVSTTGGSGTPTVYWQGTGHGEYTFSQIFGDWPAAVADVNTRQPFGWPVLVGGTAFAADDPIVLSTLPDVSDANTYSDVNSGDRMRNTLTPYGEVRQVASDKGILGHVLSATDGTCTSLTTGCLLIPLEGTGSVSFEMTGTHTGLTLLPELAHDLAGPWTYGAVYNTTTYPTTGGLITSITTNGRYTLANPHGARWFRLRVSAISSNSATIDISATAHAPPFVTATVMGLNSTLPVYCQSPAFLSMTTATTTEIVALTASMHIYVCSYSIQVSGASDVKFVSGTGSNCATSQADVSTSWDLSGADAGLVQSGGGSAVVKTNDAGDALCVTSSAAVDVNVQLAYVKFP